MTAERAEQASGRVSARAWGPPVWARIALPLGAVLPLLLFLDKPLHIDDPVYVRVAQQVLRNPADFYGFDLNWTGSVAPVSVEMQNPPLAAFALALAGAALGFDERALHGAVLLASLATAASLAWLAQGLRLPVAASVCLGIWSPALFVSSTTLMAEPWLIAALTASIAAWVQGLARGRPLWCWGAGLGAALAFLAKFPGAALVPLLFAHGLWTRRRLGAWALPLCVPIAALIAYEIGLRSLYGVSPLLQAAHYAEAHRGHGAATPLERALIGLGFLGGIELPAALLLALCAARRELAVCAAFAAAVAVALVVAGGLASLPLRDAGGIQLLPTTRIALFGAAGALILWTCARDLWARRDPPSALLALWIAGFWLHAVAFNWTINARALAPSAPAVALLAARAWAASRGAPGAAAPRRERLQLAGICAASLALSLVLAQADQAQARVARRAARELVSRHARADRVVWFLGAWGFQHYAERAGAHKVDRGRSQLRAGDVLIVPRGDLGVARRPPEHLARVLESPAYRAASWASTMARERGAGFYSDLSGPTPWALGAPPPEHYDVLEIRAALRLPAEPDRSELNARRPRERP